MAISPIGRPSPAPTGNQSSTRIESVQRSAADSARSQQNLAILEANRQVSLNSGNQSMALTYTAAIDAINRTLAPDLGENALQRAQASGLDISPKATAERIVNLTTGLFSRFQAHRPELGETQQVERFLEQITAGIEQGFAEAREVLDGLGVLEGDIAANIDRTFVHVQEGLAAFRERMLEGVDAAAGGGTG